MKFQAKKTSFTTYLEQREDLPSTVICFTPYAKKSVISKHNITIKDMVYLSFPESLQNSSWIDFNDEVSYKMGRDFNLTFGYLSDDLKWLLWDSPIHEGLNNLKLGDDEDEKKRRKRDVLAPGLPPMNAIAGITHTIKHMFHEDPFNSEIPPPLITKNMIIVQKLQTTWTGVCYKIDMDFATLGRPFFKLEFNKTLDKQDIPTPEIYITSKSNADGIIGYRWNNGEELKFPLQGFEQDFKLYPIKRHFINVTSTCSNVLFEECEADNILGRNYSSCAEVCWATSVPFRVPEFGECQNVHDYVCMRKQMNLAFGHINEKCPKDCTRTEYYGKRTFLLKLEDTTTFWWNYKFAKNIEVFEEYLIYDTSGVVGTVGGTLGLFIGFSFWNILGYAFKLLKYFIKKHF